jgi:hypothetical protein
MPISIENELGFTYRIIRKNEVQLLHHGRLAVTLRGERAQEFLSEIEECIDSDAQQLMARLTGNYKRGNERTAKDHPRNRGG